MVEISALTVRDNVTMVAGAMQYWRDTPRGDGFADWYAEQVSGRTLLIGRPTDDLLLAAQAVASELQVVTRGIPDAAECADVVPGAHIWAGFFAELPTQEPFDTVIALADMANLLPLETEARPWQALMDALNRLAAPDATVVFTVENDLGVHRLTSPRSPMTTDEDADWDPTATWDTSRPRTIEALRSTAPSATIAALWPTPTDPTVWHEVGGDQAWHSALATMSSSVTMNGADPVWPIASMSAAQLLDDHAPGWLVVRNPRGWQSINAPTTWTPSAHAPEGSRNALAAVAELCASHDLPGLRALVSAWQQATEFTAQPSYALCAARRSDSGWEVTPLVSGDTPAEQHQWTALAEVASIIRDRAWRRPWPATASAYRILNHLGLMAGFHPLSEAKARGLLPAEPPSATLVGTTHPTLLAQRDKHLREINTLRSKLRWTELMWENERLKPAAPATALARSVKKSVSTQAKKRLKQVARLLGRS